MEHRLDLLDRTVPDLEGFGKVIGVRPADRARHRGAVGQRVLAESAAVVDEAEGLLVEGAAEMARCIVLAHGFIDHSGRLGDYELTDGTKVSSPVRRPHSYYLAEAFKIRDGAIEQVEAVFHTVPYRMPSPWEGDWR